MTVTKIRNMPPSGRRFESPHTPQSTTPRCSSTVQIVNGHDVEWRKKRYGEEYNRCTRPATVILDSIPLCRRHAGERVLEQYLDGKLKKV